MKTKRYDDGGYTGDDPIVKYRMGMIDDKGNDITKKAEPSRDFDTAETMPEAAPKAVEKTVVKTKVMPGKRITGDDTINPDVKMRSDSVKQLKEAVSAPSFPKSFSDAGGNKKASKSTADMGSFKFKLPDPLAGFDSKGKRIQSRDFDYKKGGSVSSASKRGDGCATKGKTRGKMC